MIGRDAMSICRPTSSASSSKRDAAKVETKLTDKQLVPEVRTTYKLRNNCTRSTTNACTNTHPSSSFSTASDIYKSNNLIIIIMMIITTITKNPYNNTTIATATRSQSSQPLYT